MLEDVIDLNHFQSILRDTPEKLIVVDFHATWCGPCHAIAPHYAQLAARYSTRARFLKVDIDKAEDVARHASVSAMPTFHLYRRSVQLVSFSGADPARLTAEIERHAPSAADVAFASGGVRLSDGHAQGERPASSRNAAAEAAAARVAAANKAKKEVEAKEKADADADARAAQSASEPTASESVGASQSGAQSEQHGNDDRLPVNANFLSQMVDEMGIQRIRAEKALILTGNVSLERAVDWCFEHADDADIDEPLRIVKKDGSDRPRLTPKEAQKKGEQLFARARAKREMEEKHESREREKERIRSGKEATAAKAKMEEEARAHAVLEKKREKREAIAQRQRVREMLEADKQRRREIFKMPSPPVHAATASSAVPSTPPEPSAASGKIQFRLPDGSRIEGEFEASHTMSDLIQFLVQTKPDLSSRALKLSQQYPRKTYSPADYTSSLADLRLLPRGALTVSFS